MRTAARHLTVKQLQNPRYLRKLAEKDSRKLALKTKREHALLRGKLDAAELKYKRLLGSVPPNKVDRDDRVLAARAVVDSAKLNYDEWMSDHSVDGFLAKVGECKANAGRWKREEWKKSQALLRSPLRQTYSSVWLNELEGKEVEGMRIVKAKHSRPWIMTGGKADCLEKTVLLTQPASIKPPTPPDPALRKREAAWKIQDKASRFFRTPGANHPKHGLPRHAHEKICRTMEGHVRHLQKSGKTFPEYMTLGKAVEQQQYAAAAAEIEKLLHEELRILEGQ